MRTRLSLHIIDPGDVENVHFQAVSALERGHRVSVFQRAGGGTALVFTAIPFAREVAVISPVRSIRSDTPASAIRSGLAMLSEAWR